MKQTYHHQLKYKEIQEISEVLFDTYRTEKVVGYVRQNYFISESMFWKIKYMDLSSITIDPEHASLAYLNVVKPGIRKKYSQLTLF